MLSISELSSMLPARKRDCVSTPKEQLPPHQDWEPSMRTAIVILWGLLVYPQCDPDLRHLASRTITVEDLTHLFQEYLGGKQSCMDILLQLKQYDYIRFKGERIIAGTGLLTAVNAAKMVQLFRSSVLSRKLYTDG